MKNLDKQQVIIMVLAIVVACGFTLFRYIPIVRQKQSIIEKIKTQNAVMQRVATDTARVPELERQRDQLQGQMVSFTQKVPKGRNFAQLWKQIAALMNACQLSEQLIQPGQELKSDRLCSIPLTIECKGTLDQMYNFFQSLESIDRLIRIDELKLENDADFNAFVTLHAKANVYYQRDGMDNS